jgi:hypothetical protein
LKLRLARRPRAAVLVLAAVTAGTIAVATDATAAPAAPTSTSTSAASSAARSSGDAAAKTHKVIVVLKDQPAAVSPKSSSAWKSRQAAVTRSQAPLVSHLKSVGKNVHAYGLVNAVAATVSATEEASLADDPSVAEVVPDEVLKNPDATTPAAADDTPTRTAPPNTCPTGTGKTQLEPEALQVTHAQSDDPTAKTARSLGYTGKGVKVAWMAEGIDVNNPDFIRADGSHVFVDYQDFTNDGTDAPTDGAEAFLDASAIAAQGRQTYNIQNFSAVPLSEPCNIRVEGMSPGASLVGLKVFAENSFSLESGFLEAIDYAVNVDHVDVLSQSFGSNPFPDSATEDATRLFDEMAVKAGVTVLTSSGDAGPTNTIGSPATDPDVISVGGSTTYRFYAQTGYGGYYPLAKDGWLNDNISPLSSSGLTQDGRTIDLVAPGDLGWAVCTPDPDLYEGCTNFKGEPSPVEESGGTSESAPVTAGATALVIEAYRKAHHGASPTPAEVKQVLTSTADDINAPAAEQGAGRLNAYQAVLAAKSLKDKHGSPAAQGTTILSSETQLDAAAKPGSNVSWSVKLTNNGASTQTLNLGERTLGPVIDSTTGSTTLSDTASSHFTDFAGATTNYSVVHFRVPAGRARLDGDLVWPGDPTASLNNRVRLALIDPNGKFAAHSLPQGNGSAGHVDVSNPAAGTWTAMIWSRSSTVSGFVGKVTYDFTTHNYKNAGAVSPSSLTLRPGATRSVKVYATVLGTPGDVTNSLTISASGGQRTTIPIALRSLINLRTGGQYSGQLTGGNGRASFTGQGNWYQFDVPKKQKDLTANFTLGQGVTDPVYGYLVDPDGRAQAYSANQLVTGFDDDGNAISKPLTSFSAFVRSPKAGRWTFVLDFAPAVNGNRLSVPFSGTIKTNTVQVGAVGLPNSAKTKLTAGTPVTVPVTIKNTGVAPEDFFVDPRLSTTSTLTLADLAPDTLTLPLTSYEPEWLVPTETRKVTVGMTATKPIDFDFGFFSGDPDIAAQQTGTTASGTYSADPVTSGLWFAGPQIKGPSGAAGSGTASVTSVMTALTRDFDPAATTDIGDFEQSSVDLSTSVTLKVVQPGASITIPVTITPTGAKGSVVSGDLYLDALKQVTVFGAVPSGQELASLPYKYKIG